VDKKKLTETDIRTKFITPAIVGANGEKWDVMTQIREEYHFTRGRVIVRGKTIQRGDSKKADYLLFYKPNIPIAVVEAKDYSRNTVLTEYQSLEGFLSAWTTADRKQVVLEELASKGVFLDELADQVGRDYDAFDLICHIAFDKPPLTRKERADSVKKRDVFTKYGDKAKAVLEALLEKYSDSGLRSVESLDILKVEPISGLGTPVEIIKLFGGKDAYLSAIRDLENALYSEAA
jgi:type I site-specific restriction endonuclease